MSARRVSFGAWSPSASPSSQRFLFTSDLPDALRVLAPHEVEDVLCIYEAVLRDARLGRPVTLEDDTPCYLDDPEEEEERPAGAGADLLLVNAMDHGEMRAALAARATELTGQPLERLIDRDGDVQLLDSPFGVWARVAGSADGRAQLVLVAAPLLELPASEEAAVARALSSCPVGHRFASGAIQLFGTPPESVLGAAAEFRAAVTSMVAIGRSVVASVQPVLGGLTPEQQRVLAGWRARDERVEADLQAIADRVGGKLLSHAWNPRSECPPLLVVEEPAPGGWANHFVTLDASGCLYFRSSVPARSDGRRGLRMTIRKLDPEAARRWAREVGVEDREGPLEVDELRRLPARPWKELTDPLRTIPCESGGVWVPADEEAR